MVICNKVQFSNNIIFLNKKLHNFGIEPSPLCSFCNLYNELPFHIFYEWNSLKRLWSELVRCWQSLILPTSTPPTAFCGILDSASNGFIFKNNKVFINHLLLIFKLYAYKSREKMFINLNNLSVGIRKVKIIEKKIALTNSMTAKWHIINNIIP